MNHFEIAPEQNVFKYIFADITHKCNMACSNCYIPNRNIPDMDINKLYELASRLPEKVTFRLIGGEPTLRSDLPEIIETLRKMNHDTTLFTNGLLLGNRDLVFRLKKAGLNRVQLSMNGGSVNEVYKITDNHEDASIKIRALENLMEAEIITSIGMIIVDESISARAIESIIPLVESTFEKFGKRKNKSLLVPSLRFRSIGKIGRHMGQELSFSDLENIVKTHVTKERLSFTPAICGSDFFRASADRKTKSVKAVYNSKVGPIHIKVTDWKVDDDGIVDADNSSRGRITKNWTLAPFFEDIKINEFGY